MLDVPSTLLCLLGSPRREGNTDLLGTEVCQGFESEGGLTQRIALTQLNLHPCTGCHVCKQDRSEPCILDDDMQMLYERMLAASALLWVSPVYSWAPTAEMKIVLDRQFAWRGYQNTRHAAALAGRPVGLAMCYADPDPATNGFVNAYSILKTIVEASGGTFAGCVHGAALDKGDILQWPRVLQQARELGAKLFRMAAEG